MHSLAEIFELHIPDAVFVKNPRESELGMKILHKGTEMLAKEGIDSFNFKKLAIAIQTTEASAYRYFDNKHKFLLYVINIYYGWMEYSIAVAEYEEKKTENKIKRAIESIIAPNHMPVDNVEFAKNIRKVAIQEGVKLHFNLHIKDEIKNGSMTCYSRLTQRLSGLIRNIAPHYQFSEPLANLVIESVFHQLFQIGIMSKSDVVKHEKKIQLFLTQLIQQTIKNK